jgi:uncharacterized protein
MSTDVKTAIGKFVWHDHVSTDAEAARKFYTELFGWEIELFKTPEGEYPMIKAGGQTHGGFGPGQEGAPPHWIGHVLVEDADETAAKAEAAGAKVLFPAMDVPDVGRIIVIADPQGAAISIFARSGEGTGSQGTFVWDELMTSNIDATKSFYTEVFGWTTRELDMGDAGSYTIFATAGGDEIAGGMSIQPGMQASPHWLPYIATDDIEKTVARARELGGTALVESMDVPEGRIAVLKDPIGATFGIHKGNA